MEETSDVFDDPFSFDSSGDEGGSKKVKVTQKSATYGIPSKSSFAVKSKKTAAASSSNGRTVNSVIITRKKKVNEDDEDELWKKGTLKDTQ